MTHSKKMKFIGIGFLFWAIPFCSHGVLQVNLEGQSTQSQLTVTLSGQSVAYSSFEGQTFLQNPGWSFYPHEFNPFLSEITGLNSGVFSFVSGGGVLANLTSGQSTKVTGIWLQDSSNSPFWGFERFGITTSDAFQFNTGDVFQLSGEGVIDLISRDLVAGDLQIGTTTRLCDSGLCGRLRVSSVPEASTFLMMFMGMASLLLGASRLRKMPD